MNTLERSVRLRVHDGLCMVSMRSFFVGFGVV